MTKFIAWGQRVRPKSEPQPPGNSLAIIDTAYDLGYDGVELDLKLTKDGALVLIHNDDVAKTTYGSGRIGQMTTREATSLKLRDPWEDGTHFVSTFSQALSVNGRRGYVMVDLKMRRLDVRFEDSIKLSVAENEFDPRLFILLAHTQEQGLRYQQVFPASLVLLKAPANLKPPELDMDFTEKSGDINGVIAPIFSFPDYIKSFRTAADRLNKKLGVYMHHGNIKKLRQVVAMRPDFITSSNPTDFDEIREEFSLTRGPEL